MQIYLRSYPLMACRADSRPGRGAYRSTTHAGRGPHGPRRGAQGVRHTIDFHVCNSSEQCKPEDAEIACARLYHGLRRNGLVPIVSAHRSRLPQMSVRKVPFGVWQSKEFLPDFAHAIRLRPCCLAFGFVGNTKSIKQVPQHAQG